MSEQKGINLRIRNYKQVAKQTIPSELHQYLPTSFDIIGDIAVVKVGDELLEYKHEIGLAVLEAYKSIKVVASSSGVSGEYRQRGIEIIAGEERTTTVHREYGVLLEVDITQVYFSPRLATERWRVAQQVTPGETVIDAFAGVGPFSMIIAKHRSPKKVFAIDINPAAHQFIGRNAAINKVTTVVVPICGDSKTELSIIAKTEKTNRIIMNLPWNSFDFLEPALNCIVNGGMIHYYEITDKDAIDSRIKALNNLAEKLEYNVEITHRRMMKSYSPTQVNYVLDLKVTKKDVVGSNPNSLEHSE